MKTIKNNGLSTAEIWANHKAALEGFVRSRILEKADAQDVLQDVFLKIHTSLHTLKDETRIQSWVFQVARNTVNDYFRKRRFFMDADELEVPEEEMHTERYDFQKCMLPFLRRLPEKYREALVLADFKNVGQTNLARKLRISYSGAKSRVQRARQMLHSYFVECCDVTSDKYGNIISHTPKGKCLCAA